MFNNRQSIIWPVLFITAFLLPPTDAAEPVKQPNVVVARVGGTPITADELNLAVGREGYLLQTRLYELQKKTLQSLINQKLLERQLQKRSQSLEEFTTSLSTEPASLDRLQVQKEFLANYESIKVLGLAQTLLIAKLNVGLHDRTERLNRLIANESADVEVVISLPQPVFPFHRKLSDCRLGQPGAKHRLTMYTDYQCPFCRQLQGELDHLLESRSDIEVSVKQFPLPQHKYAFERAKLAICAAKMGRFAEIHPKLAAADDAELTQVLAAQVGFGADELHKCFSDPLVEKAIVEDILEGKRNGVEGTPALFWDGTPISSSSGGLASALKGLENQETGK